MKKKKTCEKSDQLYKDRVSSVKTWHMQEDMVSAVVPCLLQFNQGKLREEGVKKGKLEVDNQPSTL